MKVSHAPHACSLGSNDEHVQQTEGGEEAHVISFCSNTEEIWSVTSSVPTPGGQRLDAEVHSAASRPSALTLNEHAYSSSVPPDKKSNANGLIWQERQLASPSKIGDHCKPEAGRVTALCFELDEIADR
jgi:hypothetical protein